MAEGREMIIEAQEIKRKDRAQDLQEEEGQARRELGARDKELVIDGYN